MYFLTTVNKKRIHYTEIGAGAIDEEGRLWYSAMGFNSLFCYDIEKDELEWKGFFPNEAIWKSFLFSSCIIWMHKLIFAPDSADNIAVYDTLTGDFYQIKLEKKDCSNRRFYCLAQWDHFVYVFGDMSAEFIRIDMDTLLTQSFFELYDEMRRIGKRDVPFYFSRAICKFDEKRFFLLGGKANVLVEFDASSMDYSIIKLGDDNGGFNNLYKVDHKLFLVPGLNQSFSIWDTDNNQLFPYSDVIREKVQFFKMCRMGTDLIVFPDRANHMARWNILNEQNISFESADMYSDGELVFGSGDFTKFSYVDENDNYTLIFCRSNRRLYVYDKKKKVEKSTYLYIGLAMREQISNGFVKLFGSVWRENDLYGLSDLVKGGL